MIVSENQNKLITLITELQEESTIEMVRQLIDEGENPLSIVDVCHAGMSEVGKLYKQGTYYISGLIMAGEIMKEVIQIVFPLLESKSTNDSSSSIVLGTVEGDIHSIGKDIFKTLVRVNGFTVHDLGVDVAPGKFLAAVQEFRPKIVGLSCLITTAFEPMQKTIALLRNNISKDTAPNAYVIGGLVDELVCNQVKADYFVNNAVEGVRLCQKIMDESLQNKYPPSPSKEGGLSVEK